MAQFDGLWWEDRPRPTTRLKKGKLIGAKSHRGFVDTFNWMLAWIANFTVGAGLSLTGADIGRPKLELNLIDGNGVPVSDGDPDHPYDITDGAGVSSSLPGPFEATLADGTLTLTNCVYCAERVYLTLGTQTISGVTGSGYVLLTLYHSTSSSGGSETAGQYYPVDSADVTFDGTFSLPYFNNTATQTVIPLYHVTDGVIDLDLRAVPTGVIAR